MFKKRLAFARLWPERRRRLARGGSGLVAAVGMVASQVCVPQVASAATTQFTDGFESGNTSAWTGTANTGSNNRVTVTSAAAKVGTYGLDAAKVGIRDNGRAEVYKAIGAPSSNVDSLRAWVRVVSRSGSGGMYLQRLYRGSPVYKPVVAVHHNGSVYGLQLRQRNGTMNEVALKTQFAVGTWYDVELVYDWSSAQPAARAYVNGMLDTTIVDTNTGSVYTPDSAYVGLWEDSWTQQAEVQWDSVSVADAVQSGVAPSPSPTATATVTTVPTMPTSTATPTTMTPTPIATATPTATPTSTSGGAALAIGGVSPSSNSVSAYGKYELTFPVNGSVATNLQFPYDPAPPTGLASRIGITVEGLFLPPGQSNWSQAIHQPAFLYQDYDRQQVNGKDWLAAKGSAAWKVRFAPTRQGTWQYVIRAQDASICAAGASPCTAWVQTQSSSFNVGAPTSHGFVQVSSTDNRYFAFNDGTPFLAEGINDSFTDDTYGADARLATYAANGMSLVRAWMSSSDLAGSAWSPWVLVGANGYGGYLHDPGLVATSSEAGHDFVFDLKQANGRQCIFNGWSRGFVPVRPGTTYQISADVKAFNMTPASAGKPYGFTLKTGGWPTAGCGNLATVPGLVPDVANTNGWTTVKGTFTTASGQYFLNFLFMDLDNVSAGEAYVSQVSLREVQSGGQLGPEMLAKSRSDAHMDFNQQASYAWDQIIDTAAQDNVYLKLVVLEKNDRVWNEIQANGTVTNADNNDNFYAAPNTKVRALHQYFWRYLAARWGYATAVHSWELLNEGDPYNGNHHAAADAFAGYMHQSEPSRHMVTTSAWAAFPVDVFWGNPKYPNIDYADVHAYVSTGFGAYAWNPPTGTALETNTANTYQASPGALRIGPGVTSGDTGVAIRGQGTWTVSAMVKASGVSGSCPYGASSSLAGPQIEVNVSNGGPRRVIPYDPTKPDNYWSCTAPAGTYDYTKVEGTFTLNDTAWHSLDLTFKTVYATSGTVWYDNLVIQAPDGRTARALGDGSFDDYERNDYDTGLFNAVYGLLDGARSISGAGKPVIRGETGIDNPGGPQLEQPGVVQDKHGVWLHNLLWGSLNAGGLSDLYWWTNSISTNSLYFQYKQLHDFMASIPFANGNYQDAQPVVSSPNAHAVGQIDAANGHGYVWIWNKNHTWYNVVNNVGWGSLSGRVSIGGLPAGKAYAVQLWLFDTNGTLTRSNVTLAVDSTGSLSLDLSSVPATITDLALQF